MKGEEFRFHFVRISLMTMDPALLNLCLKTLFWFLSTSVFSAIQISVLRDNWHQVSLFSVSCFMGKSWGVSKIQDHDCLYLKMENNNINFSLFSMILKNLQITFFRWIKTFNCTVAIVWLNNFCRFFLVTSRVSRFHQIISQTSSLMFDPFWQTK